MDIPPSSKNFDWMIKNAGSIKVISTFNHEENKHDRNQRPGRLERLSPNSPLRLEE